MEKRTKILWILFFAWVVGNFTKVAISVALIPIKQEFGLNPAQVGVIMSAYFIGLGITSAIGGYVADKYGARKVIAAVIIIWSSFTGFTTIAWSYISLYVCRFIFGGAEGCYPSACSVTIAENYKKEERGRAKALILTASPLGAALGTAIVAYFCATLGWRIAFWVFCAFGAGIGLCFLAVTKGDIKADIGIKTQTIPFSVAIKESIVWRAPVLMFGVGVFLWGLNSWLPQYWVNAKGLNITTMGSLSLFPLLVSTFFTYYGGYLNDKYFNGRENILLSTAMGVAGITLILMYNASSIGWAFFYNTVAQSAMFLCLTVVYVLPLKYARNEVIGTASGLITLGSAVSGFVTPIAMGYVLMIFKGSYEAVFGMVVVVLIASILVAITTNTKKQATLNEMETST